MLHIAKRFSQLNIGQILDLYCPPEEETELICYLQEFFSAEDSMVAMWCVEGIVRSALRLEPYEDGYLLTALKTQAEFRRKGYGSSLLSSVLKQLENLKIYSHVDKNNVASIGLHKKCGFHIVSDHARFLDGSITYSHSTFCNKDTPIR